MDLVIVESPAKAKTIEKYLGKGVRVVSSVGHIRDLPKSEKKAIDIEGGFIPTYEISKGKEKVVAQLKAEAKKASVVYLATDPDREGEAIAWHIKETLGLKKPKRVAFNEITKEAVQNAMTHPRSIDEDLKYAQEARRILDRLFGYTLSALIWKKVRYGLSAGRVQSPALRILAERERLILAFTPTPYWTLHAKMQVMKGESVLAECEQKEIREEAFALWVEKNAPDAPWTVSDIKTSEVSRKPTAPLITSTLQQTANSRLGMSPAQTMRIAQKLYEKGHITYMRTDSTTLSGDAHKQIKAFVEKEFGKKYYKQGVYKTKKQNAQEAHEAIRPTKINAMSAGATQQEKALYEMIHAKTVASQMIPAKMLRKKVMFLSDVEEGEMKMPAFVVRGVETLEKGWLLADSNAQKDDVELPNIEPKTNAQCKEIIKEAKETQPPNRFSEAGLVKELEEREIGRPSTYASIIKTIVDRGYVEKQGRTLYPTQMGMVISDFLETNFSTYISDSFTSTMERDLDIIAEGDKTYKDTITHFYYPFLKAVEEKKDIEKITTLGDADKGIKCPECSGKMVKKLSRSGVFLSCAKFPECDGARTEEGEVVKKQDTGKPCPKCEKGSLIIRTGRYGDFIGCSLYPKCKYIEEDEETKKKADTGVKCSECKKGNIKERSGRFGLFYSCERYPDCTFSMNAKPTGKTCPICKKLMMEGTKTIPDRCSDKTCPNHRPDRLKK